MSLLLFTAVSCSITKKLHEGEYYLVRNEIDIEQTRKQKREDKVTSGEIESYIPASQTPNDRLFGMNLQTRVYNLANPEKKNWINNTLRRIGRPAVLFDSTENVKSLDNISLYLKYRGYFNNVVTNDVDTLSKDKKAYVTYYIEPNDPFRYSTIKYNVEDPAIERYVLRDTLETLLRPGNIFQRTVLENERVRIYNNLQENGFFTFAVDEIDYLVDTTLQKEKAAMTVNVHKRLFDGKRLDHKQYLVGDIYVDTNYDPGNSADTLVKHDTTEYKGIYFISHSNKTKVRPKALARGIMMETGDLYNVKDVSATNRRLSEISFYRNTSINFNRYDSVPGSDFGRVNCTINLMPELRQGFRVEAEASTTNTYTGATLKVGYTNKNIFRGAEIFDISFSGTYNFFNKQRNGFEFGGNASLTLPRLLFPISAKRLYSFNNVGTQIQVAYNQVRRSSYDRTTSTVSFGYNWSRFDKFFFSYRPISISLVDAKITSEKFKRDMTNIYLKKSFVPQIVAGGNMNFNFRDNSNKFNKYNVTVNTETAGNLLYLAYMASGAKKHEEKIDYAGDGTFAGDLMNDTREEIKDITGEDYKEDPQYYYRMFGLRYAQYFRGNVEFAYARQFDDKNAIVGRIYAGGAFAYGNSKVVPFERLFFAGGSNSMRGWAVRMLGPGNTPTPDSGYGEQVGNIRLEANLEGRFNIVGPLRGALFFDLGNVWVAERGEKNQEGKFDFRTFYKQLGFNTGLGLRLDFSFFVIRLDWGIQLHDPGRPVGDRWFRFPFKLRDTALHFAIGYPF